MDVLNLLVSAVIGAVFGAAASILGARLIAEHSEVGRARADARTRLLAEVRAYKALVELVPTKGHQTSLDDADPLNDNSVQSFLESVERLLAELPTVEAKNLRGFVMRLVGPVEAEMIRMIAPVPKESRRPNYPAELYLANAHGRPDEEIADTGSVGRAQSQPFPPDVTEVMSDLNALEESVETAQTALPRWLRWLPWVGK